MIGAFRIIALVLLSALPLAVAFPFIMRKKPDFGALRFFAATAAGFAAVVPAALIQAAFPRAQPGPFNLAAHSFIAIALVEEGSKYLALRLFRSSWGSSENGVPAGIAASLGFAFFETVLYASINPSAVVIRAFTAAPLHAACGAWIGRAALAAPALAAFAAAAVGKAVLVHGAYDLALMVPGFPPAVPVAIALLGLAVAVGMPKSPPKE